MTQAAPPNGGLSDREAEQQIRLFGRNEIPPPPRHPWRSLFKRFTGPSAGMLEAILALSLILGKLPDAAVVGGLLLVNALVGFLEERKADRTIDSLKVGLQIRARVLRSGSWTLRPAGEIVPGDILRIRAGDIVPADLQIVEGAISADRSALTGESLPVETRTGDEILAGSTARRGEATARVLRTGLSTRFGKTALLVQIARPKLHMEDLVGKLSRWLLLFVGGLALLTLGLSLARNRPILEILPLLLVLLLSAVPVALPVMFTFSTSYGAREMARRGVLVTRLSAAEDAATMDVLCLDKTGTLTLNEMAVSHVRARPPYSEADVIRLGAWASQAANQDPLDRAFLEKAGPLGLLDPAAERLSFVPFDPATRRTEAHVRSGGHRIVATKGAFTAIADFCGLEKAERGRLEKEALEEAGQGFKTVAVAEVTEAGNPAFVGWAALSDQIRPDAGSLIRELQSLGLSIRMLTGDAWPIAKDIASRLGLDRPIIRFPELRELRARDPVAARRMIEEGGGFAEVYPEDKHDIVRSLQEAGHVVGMTGDGVNDAPALRQAEVGIAVRNASDTAKAAASVVLTGAALEGIADLVRNGRRVYQRIRTWILNKIMRTILKSGFIVGVFLVSGRFVVSAFAMVLLLLMTDFVKIALATDHVRPSPGPDNWDIAATVRVSAGLGFLMAMESLALLLSGMILFELPLNDPRIHSLSFAILLFSALASIFVVRERGRFWSSSPSPLMMAVISIDILTGVAIALAGIPGALPPLSPALLGFVLAGSAAFSLGLNDALKTRWMAKMDRNT
jgi:H+-transporting ATPase